MILKIEDGLFTEFNRINSQEQKLSEIQKDNNKYISLREKLLFLLMLTR